MQDVLHLIRLEEGYSKCVLLLDKISDMRDRIYNGIQVCLLWSLLRSREDEKGQPFQPWVRVQPLCSLQVLHPTNEILH